MRSVVRQDRNPVALPDALPEEKGSISIGQLVHVPEGEFFPFEFDKSSAGGKRCLFSQYFIKGNAVMYAH